MHMNPHVSTSAEHRQTYECPAKVYLHPAEAPSHPAVLPPLPSSRAKDLCPDLIVVPYMFAAYEETSEKVGRLGGAAPAATAAPALGMAGDLYMVCFAAVTFQARDGSLNEAHHLCSGLHPAKWCRCTASCCDTARACRR